MCADKAEGSGVEWSVYRHPPRVLFLEQTLLVRWLRWLAGR